MTNYFRMDGWVKAATGAAIPGAQIYVCTQPANAVVLPPSPLANIFSDVNGLVPITQPILTDGFGHYDFYAQAGAYTIVVGYAGIVQQVYPDQSVGGFSGSSGGGGALTLQVNGVNLSSQATQNLVSGTGIGLTDQGGGTVLISNTNVGVPPGTNVAIGPSWGGSTVWPNNGTYEGTINPGNNITVFEQISSSMILCSPANWKITLGAPSGSTMVVGQLAIIKCTRGTGTILSTKAVTWNGLGTVTMLAGTKAQSDSISFAVTPGFDYYFALNITSGFVGTLAPGTEQQGARGGVYIAPSNAFPLGSSLPSFSGGSQEADNTFIYDWVSA